MKMVQSKHTYSIFYLFYKSIHHFSNSTVCIHFCRTCEEFQCLHSCEADYIMDTELDKPNTNNDEDGKIEVGCHMSKEYVCSTPCNAYIANEMAISFLNSGIDFKRFVKCAYY